MLNSQASISDSKNWVVVLCFIVLAAIAVRLYFFAGFIPIDEAEFARVARDMLLGTFDYERYEGPPVIPARIGIVLPTAAVMALFGIGEAQLVVYPLLSSATMIVLIYLFSARMFGHVAARIAAIIWIFLPMEITIATIIWPEIPYTLFAFIGIYCVYIARGRDSLDRREQLMYGLAGGFAFGVSWLCKESVVYFVPFCLSLVLLDFLRSRFERLAMWSGVAAASLAVLVGEAVFYGFNNGDWLYRFTTIQVNQELYREFFFWEGSVFGYEVGTPFWQAVIKRVAIDGPAFIFLQMHSLFLPSFGAIAALYGLYCRDSRFYFMGGLFVFLVAMFNGFSASLENYQPLPLFQRYFYPISVSAVVLTGGMLASLLESVNVRNVLRERPESVFWGGTMILILAAIVAWSTFRQFRDRTETWSAAEKYLAGVVSPEDRVHADALGRNALEFFWGYPDEMEISVYGDPNQLFSVRCGDYVLKNRGYSDWLTDRPGMWLNMQGFELPTAVQEPPDNWQIQWTNQNATLFRVTCDG